MTSERVNLNEEDGARLLEIAVRLESSSARGRASGHYLRCGSQAWRLERAGLLERLGSSGVFRPTARGWTEVDRLRRRRAG